jgi:hypothetical protein
MACINENGGEFMSDYKTIECAIEIKDEALLRQAIATVINAANGIDVGKRVPQGQKAPGLTVEQLGTDVTTKNRWGHTRQARIGIRQSQLPQEIAAFGDLGFRVENGKFVYDSISEHDGHLIDGHKGTFKPKLDDFFDQIQSCYGTLQKIKEVKARVPGIIIEPVRPATVDGKKGWKAKFSVPPELAARMGVKARA